KHTFNPAADFALGGLLLVVSIVLATGRGGRLSARRRERKGPKRTKEDRGTPRWQQALAKGSPRVTFLVGNVLTLPGASYSLRSAASAQVTLDVSGELIHDLEAELRVHL